MREKTISFKKKRSHLSLLPSNLEIYLTNKCNLNCSYCASSSLAKKKPETLKFSDIKKSVDLFASYINPVFGPAPGDIKARIVSFTGGEPFMEFDLLKKAVNYVFKNYKWLQISITTNGTLIDRKKIKYLLDRNVDLSISLDGAGKITDKHRRFKARPKASVFERVISNVKNLPEEYVSKIRIMSTITPETLNSLAESVRFLNGLGFSSIAPDFDMYAEWTVKDRIRLRSALKKLNKYYIKRFSDDKWIDKWQSVFSGSFQNKVVNREKKWFVNEFALSSEGKFYPVDNPLMFGDKGESFVIGDADNGIDFNKLEKIYDKAWAFISDNDCVESVISPANRYFYAVLSGKKPLPFLKNAGEMSKVFFREMGFLIEIEKIFGSFVRNGEFGDFVHKPRHCSNKEMKTLFLSIDNLRLGLMRNTLDYFLYSPGFEKKLWIKNASADNFLGVQEAVLYSVLKSKYLKKKTLLYIEGNNEDLNGEQVEFLGACGVKIRI